MEEKIVYFDRPGKENTDTVLGLVKERAQALGIKQVVLASTRGDTARAAAGAFAGSGIKLIVVPWQYYFKERAQPFAADLVPVLEAQGHRVHFGTMLFHTTELYASDTPQLMANLLRIFGEGIKVVVEIIMMATDGGCLEPGTEVIAVAGTGAGADTAVVATAAPSNRLRSLRIREILCKPR